MFIVIEVCIEREGDIFVVGNERKRMHRQIFRHIMRNTSRGRRPECLPFDETFLLKAKRFPKSEEEVRREIKNQFTNPGSSGISPFEALETSTSRSTALYPQNVPSELPAFVLPMNTVLTGESASFLLFEKRYLKMIEDSPHLFVHLPSRKENIRTSVDPVGTLVAVLKSERTEEGRMHIETLAGPRIRVLEERDEEMEQNQDDDSDNLPLLHVKFELYEDDLMLENETEIAELHDRCLEMILKMDGLWSRKRFLEGMPPLFNPERLSLWLCTLGLYQRDLQQRLTWLYCQDTAERLRFVLTHLFRQKLRTKTW